jgi:prepilin-type N-terminal cleavage/methylation domain-containing protein
MTSVRFTKGFTLVELMVALAILAIGMAGVGTMLVASYQSDRYNARIRRAEAISLKVFEKFKAGNPGATTWTDPCQAKLQASGKAAYTSETCIDTTKSNGTFYVTWNSTPQSSGLTLLDVTVAWGGTECNLTDPSKCLHRIAMSSLYR